MAVDITTLRRAADMIDEWGKRVAHDAAVNNTDPHADAGIKLEEKTDGE